MLEAVRKETILGRELRIFGDVDNPLFLAKDIAEWIGHSNASKMCQCLGDVSNITSGYIDNSGGKPSTLLTEKQVYRILMRSDKSIAMEIQDGIFEFLKAWRKGEVKVINTKTDSYMVSDPIERAKAWILEEEERQRLSIENKKIKEIVEDVVEKLENVNADVRTNIVAGIRRLSSLYCKNHSVSGIEKERIMREMFQTVYTGYCKEYNIDWVSVERGRIKYSKTGKELKGRRSIIETFEHLNVAGNLIEYIRELDIKCIKI